MAADGGGLRAVRIADDFDFGCVVADDRTVLCWSYDGGNAHGQLGNGTKVGSMVPAPVVTSVGGPPLANVVAVASGLQDDVACAVDADGGAWCWGQDAFGITGDGTTADALYAVPVLTGSGGPPLGGVAQIAVSSSHACARKTDGTLWCWGATAGFAGPTRPYPVQVTALSNTVIDVAADIYSECAATSDGSVWCWGETSGDGIGSSPVDLDAPIRVGSTGTFGGAMQVELLDNAVCALDRTDRSVWCAGGLTGTSSLAPWNLPSNAVGVLAMGKAIHIPCFIDASGNLVLSGAVVTKPVACP
jgi:alpha-tubulin suppressor-like RCC1 family protein